jgi:dephospho-CoA kinase
MLILILIGKRASGKTTIANAIEERFNFEHFEMSSLLKELRIKYNKEDLRLRKFVEFLRQTNRKDLAVSSLVDKIKGIDKVIVTGIRHSDELDFLTNSSIENQAFTIFIKLNIFMRLGRVLNRNSRSSIFEFMVEEYYSCKWRNRKLMKKCDFIFTNFSSTKTIDKINSSILCQ